MRPYKWENKSVESLRESAMDARIHLMGSLCRWDGEKWKPAIHAADTVLAWQRLSPEQRPTNTRERNRRGRRITRFRAAEARVAFVTGERLGTIAALSYWAFRQGRITESQARLMGVSENAIRAQRKINP